MTKAMMRVLSEDEIELVHQSSLRILSEVGVKIDSPSVVELLRKAGAKTDKKSGLVSFDERIISQSLKSAPRSIKICSRRGVDFEIPDDNVQLISPDGQPPAVFDVATGKKRPSRLKDVIDFAILSDALPEVDFVWPLSWQRTCPQINRHPSNSSRPSHTRRSMSNTERYPLKRPTSRSILQLRLSVRGRN